MDFARQPACVCRAPAAPSPSPDRPDHRRQREPAPLPWLPTCAAAALMRRAQAAGASTPLAASPDKLLECGVYLKMARSIRSQNSSTDLESLREKPIVALISPLREDSTALTPISM